MSRAVAAAPHQARPDARACAGLAWPSLSSSLWRPAASGRADDAAEAVEAWIRVDLVTAALTPPPKKGNAHGR